MHDIKRCRSWARDGADRKFIAKSITYILHGTDRGNVVYSIMLRAVLAPPPLSPVGSRRTCLQRESHMRIQRSGRQLVRCSASRRHRSFLQALLASILQGD